jgi:hypothetical protein
LRIVSVAMRNLLVRLAVIMRTGFTAPANSPP